MSGIPSAERLNATLIEEIITAGRDAVTDPLDPDAIEEAMRWRSDDGPLLGPAYKYLRAASGCGKKRSFPQWLRSTIRTPDEVREVCERAVDLIEVHAVTAAVDRRSGGRCEAGITDDGICQKVATEYHHIQFESQGGWRTVRNLAHLCSRCHTWVHQHIAEAIELGLAHPDTPLDLISTPQPHNWFLAVGPNGQERITSRNKARKLKRRRGAGAWTIERLAPDDPRIPRITDTDQETDAA